MNAFAIVHRALGALLVLLAVSCCSASDADNRATNSIATTPVVMPVPGLIDTTPAPVEENFPLNALFTCELTEMKVIPARTDSAKSKRNVESVNVTIRCENRSAKPIRGIRASVSLEGVFREPLFSTRFEHVWSRENCVEPGETVTLALSPTLVEVGFSTARSLRGARLADLGKRSVDITHIAFADGSQSFLERRLDKLTGRSRNEIVEVP